MAKKPMAPKPQARPARQTPVAFDVNLVEKLAEIVTRHDLGEIEVEGGGTRIRVTRQTAPAAASIHHSQLAPPPLTNIAAPPPLVMPAAPASSGEHPGAVKSPMVGTAYRRPSPEAKPFVEIGSQVAAGDRILLIEAMKTFNEIVAPRGGVVTAVMVEDGQPVEYGEPLLVIE